MRKNSLRSQSPTLSPEELAKTQVLNLSDVEKVANYEKKTSKKPAIVLAIMGVLSISLGLAYPSIQTLMAKEPIKEVKEEKITKEENDLVNVPTDETSTNSARVEEQATVTNLACTVTSPGNPDGTDTALTYNFTFSNAQLKSFTKQFSANVTLGNPTGQTTIQNLLSGYKYFETVDIEGYQIVTTPNATSTGFVVNVNVDLTKFDKTTFPTTHVYNHVSNVNYDLNADQTAIYNDLVANGFICQ